MGVTISSTKGKHSYIHINDFIKSKLFQYAGELLRKFSVVYGTIESKSQKILKSRRFYKYPLCYGPITLNYQVSFWRTEEIVLNFVENYLLC